MAPTFVVARNPDPDSTLPYLLRLPVDDGIELKAREPWPATARVYCHPLEEGWPEAAEVVEEVPVRRCARRGRAVDLVLDRARESRSQSIFTEPHAHRRGGRPMIFWQTACTARRARPGLRSDDRGRNWERLAPPEGLLGLAIDPQDPQVSVALGETRGWVSRDGGASWRPPSWAGWSPGTETSA